MDFNKIKNLILLKLGYWASLLTKRVHLWASPVAVAIEPVDYCNLRCPECLAGNGSLIREKQTMSPGSFRKIINQLSSNISYLTLYFQGEPLMHPQFSELVKITNEKGIFTSTSTNGHFFANEEKVKDLILSGIDRIVISIDGTTQETYEKYRRNGNLQQVLDGIKTLTTLKEELKFKTPFVEIQFLVMKHNEHQISEIKKMAQSLKADKLTLKSTQIYDFENGSDLMPENDKYNRYRKGADGKYRIKGKLKNYCWRQWSSVVITCTGDVIPCCFDKNAQYSFGNLFDNTFKEIWKGKKANAFRKAILNNRKSIDICNNCTEV